MKAFNDGFSALDKAKKEQSELEEEAKLQETEEDNTEIADDKEAKKEEVAPQPVNNAKKPAETQLAQTSSDSSSQSQ